MQKCWSSFLFCTRLSYAVLTICKIPGALHVTHVNDGFPQRPHSFALYRMFHDNYEIEPINWLYRNRSLSCKFDTSVVFWSCGSCHDCSTGLQIRYLSFYHSEAILLQYTFASRCIFLIYVKWIYSRDVSLMLLRTPNPAVM